MAHINNENNQMHVRRIKPEFSVDTAGNITWTPGLIDYDARVFHRGKTVTNDEFNTLFLQDVYQGNYISDSLTELFNEHLRPSIYRTFTNTFNLVPSYVKYFAQPSDWGTLQEDGYYYLTVPASEHGFEPDETQSPVERMNIDTEMYVLNSDGKFYEVAQVTTGQDNTVTAYTDDNTIMGFLVIRTNDKSYALAGETIDATQVTGLADVAISGDYTDLINKPDNRILALENTLMFDPTDETTKISKKANDANNATYATNLLSTGTIQNIPVSTIFETGVATVKNATNAVNATTASNYDTTSGTIKDEFDSIANQLNLGIPKKITFTSATLLGEFLAQTVEFQKIVRLECQFGSTISLTNLYCVEMTPSRTITDTSGHFTIGTALLILYPDTQFLGSHYTQNDYVFETAYHGKAFNITIGGGGSMSVGGQIIETGIDSNNVISFYITQLGAKTFVLPANSQITVLYYE